MKKVMNTTERALGINRCIGKRLREARVSAGLTQHCVGKILNVSHTQVGKYESGADPIIIPKLIAIAEAVLLPLEYFLEDIKPIEWDEKILEEKRLNLDFSNNFMQIKNEACKKALNNLMSVLAHIA